ncbi:MAG: DNA modification methylase [Phycisphaerae bacterium]|nr:DNA modification methylase [Phycisphaerae bacterium]
MSSNFTVQIKDITTIKPYDNNPRINDDAVDAVAASLKEFGFRQPIVVDGDGIIVCGHTRYKAALQLGLTKVPVHVATDLTPEQIRAYRIADNKTADLAEWDYDILPIELSELADAGFDMDLLAFDEKELNKLLDTEIQQGLTDPDDIPDVPDEPISQSGDLWLLGSHRLLCGDSTNADDFKRLMDGHKAEMVFCDPPYNVNYGATMKDTLRGKDGHKNRAGSKPGRKILNDNLGDNFGAFLKAACQQIVDHCSGAIYICMSSSELDTLQEAFRSVGGHWSTFIIWAKNTFTMGRADYQRQYEPILYGWPEGAKRYWCGDRNQADVWEVNKPRKNDLHPTMKPVELILRAVTNSSKQGAIVLDPFMGSGSTLIACEQSNRTCYGMELDPGYCDVVVQRWEEFTGNKAERIEATKKTPAEDTEVQEEVKV